MKLTILSLNRILIIMFTLANNFTISQYYPKIFGDNIMAYGKKVQESYDKGYLIAGSILKNSAMFKFGWLIKTDINGNVLWDKKFGDYQVENFFIDFDKTDDQGLILCGATAQEDYARDPLFVKLDPCGEIEWCKIFLSEDMNHATGVIHLPDGQYLGMLEYYGGDAQNIRISLVKMAANGDPVWIKNLAQQDSVANEEGNYLNLTPDGDYLVSGSCFSPYLNPYFIKTDTSGEELWNIKWPAGAAGFAGRTVFSNNGFIYNATQLKFYSLPKLPYLLKFNDSGEVINQYSLMGDTIYNGGALSLLLVDETKMYVGLTWTKDITLFSGYCEIYLTDTLGSLISKRMLLDEERAPISIIKSFDGKIVAIGYFVVDDNWDIYMWKMNENLEDDTLYTQLMVYDSLCPYEIQSDTVLLDCGLFVNIDEIPTQEQYESTIKISPNPASEWVVLTLPDVLAEGGVEMVVYDVFGREAGKHGGWDVLPSNRMILLDISGYASGMYIAVVRDQKGRRYTGKFVVAR